MSALQPDGGIRTETCTKWLSGCLPTAPISSNIGSGTLPFQRWFHFKEAYSPEFVAQSIESAPYSVDRVVDPFAGSGTTSLTCRMLGIDSVSIELNPFLADLVLAKVTPVSPSRFQEYCQRILDRTKIIPADQIVPEGAPATLSEPGFNDRWVFNREAYGAIRAVVRQIGTFPAKEARLARVLLGSVLVECSNVVVNGKGRRYRKDWQSRTVTREDVFDRFDAAVSNAVDDLLNFKCFHHSTHKVCHGDVRQRLRRLRKADIAIFSPPYPNSFDYTDVYNLELWMLGYLKSRKDNRSLRLKSLRSHVQIKWPETTCLIDSPSLISTIKALRDNRSELWNRNIPEMIHGYFSDLRLVFIELHRILLPGQRVIVAVGDSQYIGIKIEVPKILQEILNPLGFRVVDTSPIRSMRVSAQHGGQLELEETAMTCEKTILIGS